MGPFEFAALLICLPIVGVLVGIARRLETDGDPVPEFEAWCHEVHPVLFAFRCTPGRAAGVSSAIRDALGGGQAVEHHRGRYPWTRYVFGIAVELDPESNVILVRVDRSAIRRGERKRPEIGSTLDRLTADLGGDLEALWVHAELHEEDDAPGSGRRERGWLARIERGTREVFAPTVGLPEWARQARSAA